MNMLQPFFEIGSDKSVFEGQNFQTAREAMQYVVGSEIRRFSFLTESEKLDAGEFACIV